MEATKGVYKQQDSHFSRQANTVLETKPFILQAWPRQAMLLLPPPRHPDTPHSVQDGRAEGKREGQNGTWGAQTGAYTLASGFETESPEAM